MLVHGLDSLGKDQHDDLKTWTAEDGTVWPRVLLPRCVPEARVLCYQYNGSIKGTTSTTGMRDHAEGLLQRLSLKRGHGIEASRPIIWVGHSLGGLMYVLWAPSNQVCKPGRLETYQHNEQESSRYNQQPNIVAFGRLLTTLRAEPVVHPC